MATLGFYCFTQPTPVVELTTKQKIALLTVPQKTAILDAYINKIPAAHLDHKMGIARELLEDIYETLSTLQDTAKAYMRGEVVITPEVSHIDPVTGLKVVDTPAVYNTPPTTQSALGSVLQPLFIDTFTNAQVTAIVSAMVAYSKYDGTGTFTFYKNNIIL